MKTYIGYTQPNDTELSFVSKLCLLKGKNLKEAIKGYIANGNDISDIKHIDCISMCYLRRVLREIEREALVG